MGGEGAIPGSGGGVLLRPPMLSGRGGSEWEMGCKRWGTEAQVLCVSARCRTDLNSFYINHFVPSLLGSYLSKPHQKSDTLSRLMASVAQHTVLSTACIGAPSKITQWLSSGSFPVTSTRQLPGPQQPGPGSRRWALQPACRERLHRSIERPKKQQKSRNLWLMLSRSHPRLWSHWDCLSWRRPLH